MGEYSPNLVTLVVVDFFNKRRFHGDNVFLVLCSQAVAAPQNLCRILPIRICLLGNAQSR
jgi:hypothetical protein